jgi:hypothetical protein
MYVRPEILMPDLNFNVEGRKHLEALSLVRHIRHVESMTGRLPLIAEWRFSSF